MDEVILKEEALRLPTRKRALLAEALLDSLDNDETREIESAWAKEADSRQGAYGKGEIEAEEGTEVFRELRERYGN
ncbi:MAG: addiction module protein [Opitutae bacterium]|nr:addiction module protein [Opitutae bacterium]